MAKGSCSDQDQTLCTINGSCVEGGGVGNNFINCIRSGPRMSYNSKMDEDVGRLVRWVKGCLREGRGVYVRLSYR